MPQAKPSRYADNVSAMRAFAACLEPIANKYPTDFLDLIMRLPLVTEPEVPPSSPAARPPPPSHTLRHRGTSPPSHTLRHRGRGS